jgi:hypothetical protein
MFDIFLFILLAIVAVTLLTQLIVRWASYQVAHQVEDRIRAAETIINQEAAPEAWLTPFRKKSELVRLNGYTADQVEKLGGSARAACVKKVDDLIRFFGQERYTDSPESRGILLEGLVKARLEWLAMDGRTFYQKWIEDISNG